MSFTRTASGEIWGSAKQKASVQKAAEASARARRKNHPDPQDRRDHQQRTVAEVMSNLHDYPSKNAYTDALIAAKRRERLTAGHGPAAIPKGKVLAADGTLKSMKSSDILVGGKVYTPAEAAQLFPPEGQGLHTPPNLQPKLYVEGADRAKWEADERYKKLRRESIWEKQRESERRLDQPDPEMPSITRRQRIAVERYTLGPGVVETEAASATLNKAIRAGKPLTQEQQAWRDQLDTALDKHTLTRPVTVARVITNKAAREQILANLDNPDFRYTETGYTSVESKSTSPSLREMGMRYSGGEGGKERFAEQVFIEAELPAGTHAVDMTRVQGAGDDSGMRNTFASDEHEYLLPRGATWKVVGVVDVSGSPAPVIKMALVTGDEPKAAPTRESERIQQRIDAHGAGPKFEKGDVVQIGKGSQRWKIWRIDGDIATLTGDRSHAVMAGGQTQTRRVSLSKLGGHYSHADPVKDEALQRSRGLI